MEPEIRPMIRADKPAVIAMLRNTPEFSALDVEVAVEVCDTYLADPAGSGYYMFVATVEKTVAGYIAYGPTPLTESTWDIYWIAVAREYQRHGVGGALLTFAESNIEKAKGRLILIETSSTLPYEKARRFYISRNYDIICRIADFYSSGDDKVIFARRFNY